MSGDVWGIVRVRPNEGQTQEVREFSLRSDLCYIGSAEGKSDVHEVFGFPQTVASGSRIAKLQINIVY